MHVHVHVCIMEIKLHNTESIQALINATTPTLYNLIKYDGSAIGR